MKKRVFLITEYYCKEQNTTGYLFEKLCWMLKKDTNIDLTLLVKEDFNIAHKDKDNCYFVDAGKKDKSNLIKRFIYEIRLSLGFLFKAWTIVKKEHIVFTGTTPIFLLLVIVFLKKIINFKWILLVHDVFPENLIPAKILKSKHLSYKIIKKIFDYLYAQPERVIVIGKDMKELIFSKTNKSNIDIIQNWINSSDVEVQKREANRILQELGWSTSKETIFYYFGNIGRMQGVDIILQAIEKMKNQEQAKFLFIGDGANVSELQEKILSLQLENIQYYGSVQQSQKSDGLNAGDIALVTLAEGMLGLGVPSKSYFTMAADKPILAIMDEKSEVFDMVKTYNIGWCVTPCNIENIAMMLDNITMLNRNFGINSPRKILDKHYSESIMISKIIQVIKSI